MKNPTISLSACIFALICFTSVGDASSQPSYNGNLCEIIDFEDMRRRFPATKQALNLNVGEPRTVRMIYFLPNDRPFQQAVVDSMKVTIRQIQTFYAKQMEAHGYSRKTFRFETDAQGEPVVHRVDGQHPDSYYVEDQVYWQEIRQKFDTSANNVYWTVWDNSIVGVGDALGKGGGGRNGGSLWVGDEFHWTTVAHELGHAFGLSHDFRDGNYIMSYGPGEDRLSACHAEFLSVHPYFDPDIPDEETPRPTVELISPNEYPTGSKSVSVQLKVSDPDGLHQVFLFVRTIKPHNAAGFLEVKGCRGLNGEKDAVVEFDYDGVVPSDGDMSLFDLLAHSIYVEAVDVEGNVADESFKLWDVANMRNAIVTLEGHVDPFKGGNAYKAASVSFSSDGTTLASGSYDMVLLWNVATWTNIATLEWQGGGVTSVSFSPDGATLAAGSWSNNIKLWDVATWTNIATLRGHEGRITSVSFSPDGTTLASGSADGTVKLWDVATRTNIATLEGHTSVVESVLFSPEGTILATGSRDDTVKFWDVATRNIIATLEAVDSVTSMSFSPDGTTFAAGSWRGNIKLWDVATRNIIATLEAVDSVTSMSFSPDGTILASGLSSSAVEFWNITSRSKLTTLVGHVDEINFVVFSPDGTMLASGSADGTVKLWDTSEWLRPRPAALVKISGDNQQGVPGAELVNPLVVELRDQYGSALPLQGVPITFTITAGNGRLNGRFTVGNTTTDADGRAQIMLTLGTNTGINTIEVSGVGPTVTFNAVGVGTTTVPIIGGDYQKWYLPDGTIVRLGKGAIGKSDRAIDFSPDGQYLAVASGIGIWLYEVATSRELALLPTASSVYSVVFSPDGTTLASGLDNGRVELWEVETGTQVATLDGYRYSRVTSVVFSPDGTLLASGSWEQIIKLWDVAKREEVGSWEVARDDNLVDAISVSFSPDGTMLASGFQDGTVRLWDVATQKQVATLEGHTDWIKSVSFSPDGTTLASTSGDYGAPVRLWDVATQKQVATLEGHKDEVYAVSFSPDGTTLASGGWWRGVKLWDIATRRTIATLEHTTGLVRSVSFSPDGRTLASGSSDELLLWDVETGSTVIFSEHMTFESMAFSPDFTTLASTSEVYGAPVKLWDIATRRIIATLDTDRYNGVYSVSFSPDGTMLASGIWRGVKLWDVATGRIIATLKEVHRGGVRAVSFSPDGRTLASGAIQELWLWDVATRRIIATLEHPGSIHSVSFSPDGTMLASGSRRDLKLWDVATRRTIATLKHTDGVSAMSFSPDGAMLASGFLDGTVKLWDVATRTNISTLKERRSTVKSVSFSPDGTILASGSNQELLLWDVVTKRYIATLEHPGSIHSVSFSPDGTMLTSGSDAGTVLMWDMAKFTQPQPHTLVKVSGDKQEGMPSAELANPLIVEVKDQNGNVLEGIAVTFSVTEGDGKLSVKTAMTDSSGRAQTMLTLGNTLEPIIVAVTVAGTDQSVTFTSEVLRPQTLVKVSGDKQEGVPSALLANPLVIEVKDQNGNVLEGIAVTFSVTEGDGKLSVKTAMTDSSGRAQTMLTLGNTLETTIVAVTVVGIEQPSTFVIEAVATPDFDDDGTVGFPDFLQFVEQFGFSQEDEAYQARFDLDGDGVIGFGDFLIFANSFGKKVS